MNKTVNLPGRQRETRQVMSVKNQILYAKAVYLQRQVPELFLSIGTFLNIILQSTAGEKVCWLKSDDG
jgi:hypothetical protein